MSDRDVEYLLIGGGEASGAAVQALRERTAGSVLLVGREFDPPYERPPCSKGYLQGTEAREAAFIVAPEWYAENDVELLTRTTVTALDPASRTATLSNREQVGFGKALIATGSNVRRLHADGDELEGIHYLRTLPNTEAIREDLADAEHVVVIGGSYIGCEVAASLARPGRTVHVVMQERHPLERGFGATVGAFFGDVLASHGVLLHATDELERFEGTGRVAAVITKAGLTLPGEVVVIGAGVTPEVRLARGAGLEVGERGGLLCDAQLQTSAPGVFAAGDVCEYASIIHGHTLRLEHWDVARTQGQCAARNMLGDGADYDVVPYFFSDLADWASLEYVGPAYEWDREVVRGSIAEGSFTNWYLSSSRVVAALSVGRSEDLDHARRLLRTGAVLDDAQVGALADIGSDLAAIGPSA
jgi:3-phenylpropionate/trans-cinnamate dioxygenase ferredoxin reductase subunit